MAPSGGILGVYFCSKNSCLQEFVMATGKKPMSNRAYSPLLIAPLEGL